MGLRGEPGFEGVMVKTNHPIFENTQIKHIYAYKIYPNLFFCNCHSNVTNVMSFFLHALVNLSCVFFI